MARARREGAGSAFAPRLKVVSAISQQLSGDGNVSIWLKYSRAADHLQVIETFGNSAEDFIFKQHFDTSDVYLQQTWNEEFWFFSILLFYHGNEMNNHAKRRYITPL